MSKKSSSRPAEKMLKILWSVPVAPFLPHPWLPSRCLAVCCVLQPPSRPSLALPGDGSARLDAPVLLEVRATPHPLPPKRLTALRYAVTLTFVSEPPTQDTRSHRAFVSP